MLLKETEREMIHRYMREGRWQLVKPVYEKELAMLQATTGDTRSVCKRSARVEIARQFPPLDRLPDPRPDFEPEPPKVAPDEAPPSNLPTGSGDFDSDLEWAYLHLGSSVPPESAPSGAAWFLREHGRSPKTRAAFITMCQKAFSQKSNDDGDRLRDDRARQFALLSNLTREFAGLEKTS